MIICCVWRPSAEYCKWELDEFQFVVGNGAGFDWETAYAVQTFTGGVAYATQLPRIIAFRGQLCVYRSSRGVSECMIDFPPPSHRTGLTMIGSAGPFDNRSHEWAYAVQEVHLYPLDNVLWRSISSQPSTIISQRLLRWHVVIGKLCLWFGFELLFAVTDFYKDVYLSSRFLLATNLEISHKKIFPSTIQHESLASNTA